MVDQLIVAVLAWFHVLFAIAWLGGSLVFVFAVAPALGRMKPGTRLDFFRAAAPFSGRFFGVAGSLTILFGLFLLLAITDGNFSRLLTSLWGFQISVGLTLGFSAFLMALYSARYFNRAYSISRGLNGPDAIPPPDFQKAFGRARTASSVETGILLLTLVFMVASAFY